MRKSGPLAQAPAQGSMGPPEGPPKGSKGLGVRDLLPRAPRGSKGSQVPGQKDPGPPLAPGLGGGPQGPQGFPVPRPAGTWAPRDPRPSEPGVPGGPEPSPSRSRMAPRAPEALRGRGARRQLVYYNVCLTMYNNAFNNVF